MTKHTINGREFLFVPVPGKVSGFHTYVINSELNYFCWQRRVGENESFWGNCSIKLPSRANFIATTTDITEEQAAEIVESYVLNTGIDESDYNGYYFNYNNPPKTKKDVSPDTTFQSDALKSFASYLQAYNITGRQAIIKIL